jgi:hypothetical protein
MRISVIIILILLIPYDTLAEAWPEVKGKTPLQNSLLYNRNQPSEEYECTADDVRSTSKLQTKNSMLYSIDASYGLSNDVTLVVKLLNSLSNLKFSLSRNDKNNNKVASDFTALQVQGAIGFRALIHSEGGAVLSFAYNYHPGHYVNYNNRAFASDTLSAGEYKLMLGKNHKRTKNSFDRWLNNSIEGLYSYSEWHASLKHYHKIRHTGINLKFEYGFKFNNKTTLGTSLDLSFNNFSKGLSEYEQAIRFSLPKSTHSAIKEYFCYDNSMIGIKLAHDIKNNKTFLLESYHSVIHGKPFKNHTVLVGLVKYF